MGIFSRARQMMSGARTRYANRKLAKQLKRAKSGKSRIAKAFDSFKKMALIGAGVAAYFLFFKKGDGQNLKK